MRNYAIFDDSIGHLQWRDGCMNEFNDFQHLMAIILILRFQTFKSHNIRNYLDFQLHITNSRKCGKMAKIDVLIGDLQRRFNDPDTLVGNLRIL